LEAQKRILKQIIDTNGADLITDINPLWFTDNINLELYNSITEVIKTSESIDEESIKTYIQMNGYKPEIKRRVLGRLNDIIRTEYQPTSDALERLENEFKEDKLRIYAKHLLDKDATLASRLKMLEDTYKQVSDTAEAKRIYNMNTEVHQYLDDIKKGVPDRFIEKSIQLDHEPLKRIFGNTIYPFVYAIGGRPGFRKTDLLINLAVEFERLNKYGMIFSFEDVLQTFRNKYIAIKNQIPKSNVNEMKLEDHYKKQIQDNTGDKKSNKIFFYDRPCTATSFKRIVDQQMKLREVDYIMVDYLQLFIVGKKSRHEEINEITRVFMRTANEYLVPLIFTSQVNERKESTSGKVKLDLGDFKESVGSRKGF